MVEGVSSPIHVVPMRISPSWIVVALIAILAVAMVASSLQRPTPVTFAVTPPLPTDVGDSLVGPVTYTIDTSDADRWVYFDFSRGSVVAGEEGPGWDLAFNRFNAIVNGGPVFEGKGGAADLGEVAFDSIRELPAVEYEETFALRDSTHATLGDWYDYSFTSHLLTPKPNVFAVRTADGRYAKLRFLSYYCPGPTAGCLTFEYVYQGAGGGRVSRP